MEKFYGSYKSLFGEKDEGGDSEDEEDDRPDPIEIDNKSYIDRWGWYETLYNLTNGDLTKWDIVLEWNVVRFLNTLSFIKDKQKRERKQNTH